jgi:ABC-type uncharacterized transport system fused permease/ATPase subunit
MRGSYEAWRVDEWHTFWCSANAYTLDSVVSSNVNVPIEYATTAMQSTLQNLFVVGGILGAWHSIAFTALLFVGARMRSRSGTSHARVALEIGVIVLVIILMLGALAWLFTLPSSLATKVDFRTALDVHTDSLIWSSAGIIFIVPGLSIIAALAQIFLVTRILKTEH